MIWPLGRLLVQRAWHTKGQKLCASLPTTRGLSYLMYRLQADFWSGLWTWAGVGTPFSRIFSRRSSACANISDHRYYSNVSVSNLLILIPDPGLSICFTICLCIGQDLDGYILNFTDSVPVPVLAWSRRETAAAKHEMSLYHRIIIPRCFTRYLCISDHN